MLMAAKDHYLSTDDFTEIQVNLIRGLKKYLVLGNDTEAGVPWALDCAKMFVDFFTSITECSDYTSEWPGYRRYIIKCYTSWVGHRDNTYSIFFNKTAYHKYKMKNLGHLALDQSCNRGHGAYGGGSNGYFLLHFSFLYYLEHLHIPRPHHIYLCLAFEWRTDPLIHES